LPRVIRENEFAAKGANAKKAKTSKTNKDFDRYLTTIPVNGSVADPAKNTFYFCPGPDPIMDGGPFAEWVDEDTYIIDTDKITFIDGSVAVEGDFCVDTSENYRRLYGNGLPNHNIGSFPINKTSEAYKYYKGGLCPIGCFKDASEIDVNPYTLDITLPKNPVYNKEPTCIGYLTTGVATVTGVAFHVEYAELGEGEAKRPNNPIALLPLDSCFGHPINNAYHYHAKSWECFPDQGKANKHSPLFGYAIDGFGIFGQRTLGGKLVTNDDLDVCHGHIHEIDWDGEKANMYHYHLNTEFPYSIGCFRGTPVKLDETLRTTCELEEIKAVSFENMTEVPIKKECL
jgi:hypothetical protein